MTGIRIVKIAIILLGWSWQVNGQKISLVSEFPCYEDTADTLTIAEISHPSFQEKFARAASSQKGQTFSSSSFWFKISHDSSFYQRKHLISKNIFLDSVQVFDFHQGAWRVYRTGLLVPDEGASYTSLMSINLSGCGADDVYIKVSSDCLADLDIWLMDEEQLHDMNTKRTALYAGLSFIVILYVGIAFFLFYLSKKTQLLFLALYSLTSLLFALFMNGFFFFGFVERSMFLLKWSFAGFIPIYLLSSLLFSYHILKEYQLRAILKGYQLMFVLVFLMVLSSLIFDRQLVTQIHFFTPTVILVFNVLAGTYAYVLTRKMNLLLFSLGWFLFLSFSLLWSWGKLSLNGTFFLIDHATTIGMFIELIMFAVIAGRQYKNSLAEKSHLAAELSTMLKNKESVLAKYDTAFSSLSGREMEVLALLAQGLLDKEISDRLSITKTSVRTYCTRLYKKLGVHNRTEAAEIYNQMKIYQLI